MNWLEIINWIAIIVSIAQYIIKDNVIFMALSQVEMSAQGCTVNAFLLILQGSLPDMVVQMKAIAVLCSFYVNHNLYTE